MTERVHPVARLPHRLSLLLTVVATVSLVAGCSSKIGSQGSGTGAGSGPQAVVTPIGHKATQANGVATINVRSGADVLLSGKDTVFGSAALTSFAWSQSSSDTPQVDLIYRTANTVSFTAPSVAQATPLNLTLTVVDAHNNSSTAKVIVNVQPASDPGQFLTTPVTNPSPRTFQVAIVPQQDLTLTTDTTLCMSLTRTINYTERGTGTTSTPARPLQLPATQKEVKLLQTAPPVSIQQVMTAQNITDAGVATNRAIASYTNPRATFDLPIFNDEELFIRFNQPQGTARPPAIEPAAVAAARIAQQLEPADVDSASLDLSITVVPGKCGNPQAHLLNDVPMVLSIVGSIDNALLKSDPAASPSINLTTDGLRTTLQDNFNYRFAETADTAKTYYQNIDPIGSATNREDQSLNKWLDANCFNSSAPNYGADTHAVYTNNFDLGFGRDMYFVTCTQGNLSTGRTLGDSASVVINYPSLETAVLKQNVIVAVAMSHNTYSAKGNAPQRFTKFFAFAPDDRNGNLYLVRSVNFDRRGQRYVPGACTACHGGTVSKETVNGAAATVTSPTITAGDLSAGFMPWDEGSLLFSDTDPAYTGGLVPKTSYKEADQAAAIYALNQHAYATYLTSDPKDTRFAASMALIKQWYKGLAGADPAPGTLYSDIKFQSQTFSDSAFPTVQAKDSNGNDISGTSWNEENTANGDDLYHKVFAHECRACHTQLDNTTDPTGTARLTTYEDFKNLFAASGGTPANGAKSVEVLAMKLNEMPLARLTADRFWVDYDGGTSAASKLALHGANVLGVSNLLANNQAIAPGNPIVSAFAGTTQLTDKLVTPVNRFTPVALDFVPTTVRADASSSFFVGSYAWTLCRIAALAPGMPALPPSTDTCNPFPTLLDASDTTPAFGTSQAGIYRLTLAATGPQGQTVSAPTYEFDVPRTDPIAPTCTVQISTGSTATLGLDDLRCTGGLRPGDGTNTLVLGSLPPGYATNVCIAGSGAAFSANGGVCPTASNRFVFAFNLPIGSQPGSIPYQLCDSADGACASGAIQVTPVTQPTANSASYKAHLPLATFTLAGTSTSAQNGSVAPFTLSGGTVAISVDALRQAGDCNVPGGNTDLQSLAQFFTLTPCTDHFTVAFSPVLTVTPPGATSFLLGGNHTAAVSPVPTTPICSYSGTSCSTTTPTPPTPAFTGTYKVNDVDNGLSSQTAMISVYVLETQSFGDSNIGAQQGTIYSYLLNGGCGGCHSSGNAAWNLNGPDSAFASLTSSACNTSSLTEYPANPKCIDTSNPTSSTLYINACTGTHRGSNNQFGGTTPAQWCANLLQWLNEGAQPK